MGKSKRYFLLQQSVKALLWLTALKVQLDNLE